MRLTKELLSELGWKEKSGIMVLFSTPRLGWKTDGTLVIGYHEHPNKIYTLEKLNETLRHETQRSKTEEKD